MVQLKSAIASSFSSISGGVHELAVIGSGLGPRASVMKRTSSMGSATA